MSANVVDLSAFRRKKNSTATIEKEGYDKQAIISELIKPMFVNLCEAAKLDAKFFKAEPQSLLHYMTTPFSDLYPDDSFDGPYYDFMDGDTYYRVESRLFFFDMDTSNPSVHCECALYKLENFKTNTEWLQFTGSNWVAGPGDYFDLNDGNILK